MSDILKRNDKKCYILTRSHPMLWTLIIQLLSPNWLEIRSREHFTCLILLVNIKETFFLFFIKVHLYCDAKQRRRFSETVSHSIARPVLKYIVVITKLVLTAPYSPQSSQSSEMYCLRPGNINIRETRTFQHWINLLVW